MEIFIWLVVCVIVGFVSYKVGLGNGYEEGWAEARNVLSTTGPKVSAQKTETPVVKTATKTKVAKATKTAKTARKSKKGGKSR